MRIAHLEGERKQVTVLFADVVGSTALAEQMDPEQWAAIMNGAFETLTPAIHRYEGTIARLMGDALLAFFGAPVAHEDDPIRAIRAAMDLITAAEAFAESMRQTHSIEFAIRVGLNTGTVVVGAVGSDLMYEYTAMGDEVNLAARMQSSAEPGTILITEHTYRLAKAFFEFDDRGWITVKGKSAPVRAYQVTAQVKSVVQARGIQGLDSPLVGRDSERESLIAAIRKLSQGRGQVISIIGEAGLGKSRLVAEIRRSAELTDSSSIPPTWLEGRSLSYQTATPFAPFINLLPDLLGVSPSNDQTFDYTRVKDGIQAIMPGDPAEIAPFIASLLGVKVLGGDVERIRYMEPPQLGQGIFKAVNALVKQLSQDTPLILVFEDLHWVDSTSLELIEGLLPLIERCMLMVLAVFRPHREEPSWRFHEIASREFSHRYTTITLEPLNEGESRQLVGNLLHIEDLPEKVRHLLLRKAEGNPFFVEELIRSLLDSGLVVRFNGHWRATREIESIAIPDTLVGVISSRLDRLDAQSKSIAQTASVIGREFPLFVLKEVSSQSTADIDNGLVTLQRRELVREKIRLPEQTYLFKHALVQETAYASLLLSQRRRFHQLIAECYENIDPERVNDIARHYLEAGHRSRALPYLVKAADRAAQSYSTTVALSYFTQALAILEEFPNPSLAYSAYTGKGQALMFANDIPSAIEHYHAMLAYGEAHDDIPLQVAALNRLSQAVSWMGQMEDTERYLQKAEALARQHDDKAGLAEMYTVRCEICNMIGDLGGVAHYMGESIQLGRRLNVKEQMVYGLTHMSGALTNLARLDEAWETIQEALPLVEELGHLLHKATLFMYAIPFHYLSAGDLDSAYNAAQTAKELSKKIGIAYMECPSEYMLGSIDLLRGNYGSALAHFQSSKDAGIAAGVPFLEVFALGGIGTIFLETCGPDAPQVDEYHDRAVELLAAPMGQPAGGFAWADIGFCLLAKGKQTKAQKFFDMGLTQPSQHSLINRPRYLVGFAYLALQRMDLEESLQHVLEAYKYVNEKSLRHLEPEVGLAAGRVFAAREDLNSASEHLDAAYAAADRMGMRPIAWQILLELSKVNTRIGQPIEADSYLQNAYHVVDEIALGINDSDLRNQFYRTANTQINQAGALNE